jgi:hypothetical protein
MEIYFYHSGAETTYNTYPAAGASVSTAYAATTPGTTYTSYTINPTASTPSSTSPATYNYVSFLCSSRHQRHSPSDSVKKPDFNNFCGSDKNNKHYHYLHHLNFNLLKII